MPYAPTKMNLAGRSLAACRKRLLAWYGRHKRTMPWRGTRDAYRVWMSEIMLQQTRVAAVEPYYRRFLKRFPTVRALARAGEEEVLKYWAGLGYYSRARNLHRAAKEIVARHNGKFPRAYEAALALPGVGRYTAAAVLSIAYGEPRAVVDGNVARVVARLSGMRGDVRETGRWKKLEERAQELMGASFPPALSPSMTARSKLRAGRRRLRAALHTRAGEWNQAMMELGATVCTPRTPRCEECPVARWCKAYQMGIAEQIPFARKKRVTERIEIAVAVLLDGYGSTLLVNPGRADADGLFARLWQFPAIAFRKNARAELRRYLWQSLRFRPEQLRALPAAKHSVTYRELTLRPFLGIAERLPRRETARTAPLGWVKRLAVSSATKKIARIAERSVAS